jgi:hypothetical protein
MAQLVPQAQQVQLVHLVPLVPLVLPEQQAKDIMRNLLLKIQ